VLFYPKTDKYAFADTDKAVFAVESDILSLCDDFKSYGKMRFAEEISRGTDLGIRNHGFLEEVYDVKGNDVYMMYSSVIRRCICEIYYTGDAQTEIVREEISKVFEGRRGHIENIAENKAVLCSKARAVKEKRSISESMLYVGFAQKEDRGKENIFPVMILNEIFGGSSGMLFRKVREQKALCYYVSGSLYSFKQLICAEAAIDEKDMKKTVKAIKDAFEDIRKEENVKERINTAKNILKKKALSIKDSGDSMVDFCLDNSINGFEYTIEEFADRIEKTTEEDVLKCAENFEMDTVYFLEGVK